MKAKAKGKKSAQYPEAPLAVLLKAEPEEPKVMKGCRLIIKGGGMDHEGVVTRVQKTANGQIITFRPTKQLCAYCSLRPERGGKRQGSRLCLECWRAD